MTNMLVTVDAVVFAYIEKELNVLLIKRAFEPFIDQWALPGGFIFENEDADTSVVRKLFEETNVKLNYLEQLYTFTHPKRDPRQRVISISYYALINPKYEQLLTNVHATEVQWFPIKKCATLDIGFDHYDIIRYAHTRLQNKIKYEPIGFELLPTKFTMNELCDLYKAIREQEIDHRNFTKKIRRFDLLKKTQQKTSGHVGRKAELFEFNKDKYNKLKLSGFNFNI